MRQAAFPLFLPPFRLPSLVLWGRRCTSITCESAFAPKEKLRRVPGTRNRFENPLRELATGTLRPLHRSTSLSPTQLNSTPKQASRRRRHRCSLRLDRSRDPPGRRDAAESRSAEASSSSGDGGAAGHRRRSRSFRRPPSKDARPEAVPFLGFFLSRRCRASSRFGSQPGLVGIHRCPAA